jgi:acyl-CoA reductase-like NAD-dependent aldehyde dehydrogenase
MKFFNVVNGQSREGETSHQCVDPRTEEPLWDAPIASLKDLDDAVAAAQDAQKTWGKSTIEERSALLKKMVEIYQANKEELFEIIMKETGKSVSNAKPRGLLRDVTNGA